MPLKLTRIANLLAYRRLIKVLERHCVAQERTNELLARLVERFAPLAVEMAPQPSPADQRVRLTSVVQSDISHLDPDEMQAAQEFIVTWTDHHGQPPTEDEVFAYLGDFETQRLTAELNQLDEAKRSPWSR